ncbi:MAG: hypothetical protein LBM59_03150 [Ruminococcus sp.]|jgi:hypothetical protein|nr:hypothetical protein [Ruminococcus sp.]
MNRAKISYIVKSFTSGSLSLFSSLANAAISAEVRLFSENNSETLIFETIANNIRGLNTHNKSDIIYLASESLELALSGATIVILETEIDGELIKRYCPDAWCIYRGLEPTKNMLGIKSGFSDIKMLLSDDQTDSVRDLLYDVIKDRLGVEKPKRRDLLYNLSGIPYFCFLTDIFYDGKPIFDEIKEYAKRFPEDYRLSFFARYGMLPAASNDDDVKAADSDFPKLVRSLRYGEAVLPVGNFTETSLTVKSLTGGGNLVTDAGVIVDGKVMMTGVLIGKNSVRRLL